MIRKLATIGFVYIGIVLAAISSVRADETAEMVRAVSSMGHDVPSIATLRNACDADALCVARFLRDRIGAGTELVAFDPRSQKVSGWHKAKPALISVSADEGLTMVLALSRYDANAVLQTIEASPIQPTRIVLDVRSMDKEMDLDGMRRLASLFMGHKKRAFQVRYATGKNVDWRIPTPTKLISTDNLEVMVGTETDAAGEVFALLLQKHARAKIIGEQTRAGGFILEQIPVTFGWMLNVPRARVHVPEIDILNGVSPSAVLAK